MRVGFAGTPAFAARALEAIARAGYTIPLVLTQPDRPKGRGLKLEPSPVKALAASLGIPVLQPAALKSEAARAEALAIPLDVLVVAAYGLILPEAVLAWPRHGCLNIHASKLPRWRGAAPIVRAIEAGDATTGITIMQMDAGLDTGPMLLAESIDIDADETAGHLTTRLADLGATLLVQALASIDELGAQPQPAAGATYAAKIDKAEAWLDWSLPAAVLARKVRAYDPFPVAHTRIGNTPIKVWRAMEIPATDAVTPGTIVAAGAAGIDVRCGEAGLRLTELQRAGGKRLPAREFLAGHALMSQQCFDSGPAHE
jgi:methionyl-tRNA formyltransferase